MILFSKEDIKHQSIPTVWFYRLFLLIAFIILFRYIFLPGVESCTPLFLSNIVETIDEFFGLSLFERFSDSITRECFIFLSKHHFFIINTVICKTVFQILLNCLFGFILISLPYYITGKRGMGSADVLYFTLLAALYPFSSVWSSYLMAFLSGTLWCGMTRILMPEKKVKVLPFIPFLSFGFFISLVL